MSVARHDTADQRAASRSGVGGIFLVGMFASGVELLGGALSRLGLPPVGGDEGSTTEDLTSFNDRLLTVAAGTRGNPPDAAPVELARLLAPWADEARERMAAALESAAADSPWVWADPRLSFLAPFWSDALGTRPAVILVHRSPGQVTAVDVPEVGDGTDVVGWWDRFNRSALVVCSEYPSLVVNYDDAIGRPKAVLTEISEFLVGLGVCVDGDVGNAIEFMEGFAADHGEKAAGTSAIDPRHRTLDRLLTQLDGPRMSGHADAAGPHSELVEVTADFYDEDYYRTGCDKTGLPYSREEKVWVDFFGSVAGTLVKTLRPTTVLDVGCALGMLVEALRERGVDARGIDISTWAIDHVPDSLRPFCRMGSVTEEIDGHFDLITCVEVLEHLPPSLADTGIGNLCRHADLVLFSSTPDDFDEPTHLNVEPSGYWAQLFLRHGFVQDLDYDATVLAPHAMLFRRRDVKADVPRRRLRASALAGDL